MRDWNNNIIDEIINYYETYTFVINSNNITKKELTIGGAKIIIYTIINSNNIIKKRFPLAQKNNN